MIWIKFCCIWHFLLICPLISGFLNSGTSDIWIEKFFFGWWKQGWGCPLHCRMFVSFSGLYLLDISGTTSPHPSPSFPWAMKTKIYLQTLPKCLWEEMQNHHQLRKYGLVYKYYLQGILFLFWPYYLPVWSIIIFCSQILKFKSNNVRKRTGLSSKHLRSPLPSWGTINLLFWSQLSVPLTLSPSSLPCS